MSKAQHLQGDSTADHWNRAAKLKSAAGEGGDQKEEGTRGRGCVRKGTASNKQGAGGREGGRRERSNKKHTQRRE